MLQELCIKNGQAPLGSFLRWDNNVKITEK
jgi:hypothetical protein